MDPYIVAVDRRLIALDHPVRPSTRVHDQPPVRAILLLKTISHPRAKETKEQKKGRRVRGMKPTSWSRHTLRSYYFRPLHRQRPRSLRFHGGTWWPWHTLRTQFPGRPFRPGSRCTTPRRERRPPYPQSRYSSRASPGRLPTRSASRCFTKVYGKEGSRYLQCCSRKLPRQQRLPRG